MKILKIVAFILVALILTLAFLLKDYLIPHELSEEEYRKYGDLVEITHAGQFTIEKRIYPAGAGDQTFCNYWIDFNGAHIDSTVEKYGYVNNYNNCKAVLVTESNVPAFFIGLYSQNYYIPVLVYAENDMVKVQQFAEPRQATNTDLGCGEDAEVRYGGLVSKNHVIEICGQKIDMRTFEILK